MSDTSPSNDEKKAKVSPLQRLKDTVRQRKKNEKAATQRFLPIAEIRNDTVLLKNGGMRAVLQVEPLNFNLKSETEQQGIIVGYEGFMNTLTFPIQIVMRSTKVNIDPYIDQIHARAAAQDNELLKQQTLGYAAFIEKIVDVADIMQKRFFLVIPLDDTETSTKKKSFFGQFSTLLSSDDSPSKAASRFKYFNEKNQHLKDRIQLVQSGLHNVGLMTHRLTTRELIELYYQSYNPKTSQEQKIGDRDVHTQPMVL